MSDDIIDVDYIINESSEQDRPQKRRIIVEEETSLGDTEVRREVNPDAVLVAAGAAAFAWGFSELWKWFDREEERQFRESRRRLNRGRR